ncbi:hypothetical protein ASC77_25310 [Nocardioides sp. Root1257]|nr:hypothetical protein ASC77_25310 [Nocardioides sp. Root1257]KRC53771.1 hypothetical protein ASE24_25100 [Nocardioides sp. Root224]
MLTTAADAPRVSRRGLMRGVGLGGATVLVAGTGALSYRVYDTAALNPGAGPAFDPWGQWRTMPGPLGAIACAVLAASPHNTQPWAFALGTDRIDVLVDEERGTGAVDPLRREQYVGLGCAVENLVLGADARGLSPRLTWLPDGDDSSRVASVALGAGEPTSGELYDAIGDRHTNRGPYTSRPISPGTLAELGDTSGLDGISVHWVVDPQPKAVLSEMLIDAAEALTRDEQQSRDGFVWFRSSNDDIQRHRDGLVLDGQGLSPLVLGIAKLLPASSRADGDDFWVTQTRTVHTATATAYGVVTTATPDDRRSQLDAGRLLQRIHLAATSRGIALQHMNQITERIDRETTTGAPQTFAPRFAELLPDGRRPLLTFRIGYPVRAARETPRRSAASVTS